MPKTLTLGKIKKLLKPIFAEKKPIRSVVLFGSFARGEGRELSDLDLVVDSKEEMLGLALFSLAEDVRTTLDMKVDLFESCEIVPETQLYWNIKREGVVIYER